MFTIGKGSGKRARGCRSISSESVTTSSSRCVSTSGTPAYAMPLGSCSESQGGWCVTGKKQAYLAHQELVVDDVARERAGRRGEVHEELGAGERILLVVRLHGVGEVEEVALGHGDGEDPAALVVVQHVEMPGHGVRRVLLGAHEPVVVVVVLGDVGPLGDAPEEARVPRLQDLGEARVELHPRLRRRHTQRVARREQLQAERAQHGVEREGARADARDVDPEAVLERLETARAHHHLDDRERGDDIQPHGEHGRRRARLLLLKPEARGSVIPLKHKKENRLT
jgi:hypothetical protein